MCGILGVLLSEGAKCDQERISAIAESLDLVQHRGPDGLGFLAQWNNSRPIVRHFNSKESKTQVLSRLAVFQGEGPGIVLGHRRLSILDLTTAGAQPFGVTRRGSSEPDLWVTYNGEIYNYLELREELVQQGYRFETGTDTEVILRAYEVWGAQAFSRFNGMWAIAIWDSRTRELVLSRDRMGVKPLYYCEIPGGIAFGSEIKQLLRLRPGKAEWNPYRLYEFLAQSHQHHAEETFYEGVFQFRPAHLAVLKTDTSLRAESVRAAARPFWNFPVDEHSEISFGESSRVLKDLLESSIKLRLRSDVPVGSALSGGIDSSAIVAMLGRLNPKSQKTFSASFPGTPFDERRYAEEVIKNTDISGVFIQPDPHEFVNQMDRFIHIHDGPVASSSTYAQWEVFRAARANDVTVMLDGQGADELFAGYEGFFWSHLRSVRSRVGSGRAIIEGAQFVYNHPRYFTLKRAAKKFGAKTDWLEWFRPVARDAVRARLTEFARSGDPWLLGDAGIKYRDPLRQALYVAAARFSLPALLTYEDRNSMAWSVESRTPFLDYRIVEFAFRCPSNYLIRDGMRKSLLRESLKGVIPESIRMRKDKLGFATPEQVWAKKAGISRNHRWVEKLQGEVLDPSKMGQMAESAFSWKLYSVAAGMAHLA